MKGLKTNISLEEFDKLIPHDDMPPSKKMIRLEKRVLVEAIERSRYDLVKYLVEYINTRTSNINTQISNINTQTSTLKHQHSNTIHRLRGNAILSASDTDSTIMMAAVKQDDVEIIRYLHKDQKLDFSRRDSGNRSLPIHIAMERGMSYDLLLCPLMLL